MPRDRVDRPPAVVFATGPGGTTLDRDSQGGNPFATALIQLAGDARLPFHAFPRRLRTLTERGSRGHQRPEWTHWPGKLQWRFQAAAGVPSERRCALVLVVSAYQAPGLAPLGGAAFDERRIAAMFAAAGFSVVQGVASTRRALVSALTAFRRQAQAHDVAMIYCTGHGLQTGDDVYLLPADFTLAVGLTPGRLKTQALPIERLVKAARGTRLNVVFFAGCRTKVRPASRAR